MLILLMRLMYGYSLLINCAQTVPYLRSLLFERRTFIQTFAHAYHHPRDHWLTRELCTNFEQIRTRDRSHVLLAATRSKESTSSNGTPQVSARTQILQSSGPIAVALVGVSELMLPVMAAMRRS